VDDGAEWAVECGAAWAADVMAEEGAAREVMVMAMVAVSTDDIVSHISVVPFSNVFV
jgi:hypothetical protein